MPLLREYLPYLRSLKLHNIFISKTLAEFIISRTATLHELRLHDCRASTYEEPGHLWAEIFTYLYHNKTRVRELDVAYRKGDLALFSDEENRLEKRNEEDRIFSYGMLDDKYKFFMGDDKKIREKYDEGRTWMRIAS